MPRIAAESEREWAAGGAAAAALVERLVLRLVSGAGALDARFACKFLATLDSPTHRAHAPVSRSSRSTQATSSSWCSLELQRVIYPIGVGSLISAPKGTTPVRTGSKFST
ncbi:Protein of unknown function [Gryllus bimaculatus]|nr:Protein of unknown function [Gryllus bimaculatus]